MNIGICKRCNKETEYKFKCRIKDFCSHSCSNQWKWDNTRDKAEVKEIICEHCLHIFEKKISFLKQHPTTKYCSRKCMGLAKRTKEPKEARISKKREIECPQCKNIFIDTRGKYCSKKCFGLSQRVSNPNNKNKDWVKSYNKEYNSNNKEKINATKRKYNKTEKGKMVKRATQLKRRSAGNLTTGELEQIIINSKYNCYWCGLNCKKDYQIDHYLPIAKGGQTILENMVLCCKKCNQIKSAKNPLEFANSIGRLL